jgi:hypothetical protein
MCARDLHVGLQASKVHGGGKPSATTEWLRPHPIEFDHGPATPSLRTFHALGFEEDRGGGGALLGIKEEA